MATYTNTGGLKTFVSSGEPIKLTMKEELAWDMANEKVLKRKRKEARNRYIFMGILVLTIVLVYIFKHYIPFLDFIN